MAADELDPPDSQLWSRTQAGDPQALALLYERHATAIFSHCYQRLLSRSDAEDLTAEVFLVALRSTRQVDVPSKAGARPWLLGIANNLLRRHGQAMVSAGRLARAVAAIRLEADDPADAVIADDEDRYHLTVLAAVLSRLPAADREVIQLCVLQGLSPAQVAPLVGARPGTVRSRLSRALDRARRQLTNIEATVARDNHVLTQPTATERSHRS
jgi:RNA polymerase sigma-70 factor (ECF subfamily)